jgi:hypothetical protein
MAKVVPEEERISQEERKHLPVLKEKEDPPKEIRLSGTAITEAGKLTKHRYFEFLHMDLDDYTDLSFTPEEAQRIRGQLSKMSTGATTLVPMTCSPQCPFRNRCVFYQMGKAPFARSCLLEVNLLREWTTAYFNEYNVDPNNFTELGIVNELAEIEVYQWRLNMNLAKAENAELVTDVVVGATPQGTPLVQKQISAFLNAKQLLASRKSKLVKLMVGDRQEKYKKEAALKIREDEDPSSSMADLRGKLERIQRDLRKKELDLAEKAGQIIEVHEIKSPEQKAPSVMTPDDLMRQSSDEE